MTPRLSTERRALTGDDLQTAFALDVRYYLSLDPRQLPSKYFYDELGSALFEAICRLPWYPITRAEMRLLSVHGREILTASDELGRIVELGCGSGEKLLTLLDCRSTSILPIELHLIDVSASALQASSRLLSALEGVRISTHQGSYEAGLTNYVAAVPAASGRTLMLLLGSNIGNFDPPSDDAFLHTIRAALRTGDLLLTGADLVKPPAVLQLAYDDPLGVTAAFNLNLLVRINRELGGTFDVQRFAHEARWNEAASRMEMHLVSRCTQTLHIPASELQLDLQKGESIWTESSYKYRVPELMAMLERTGFTPVGDWIDSKDCFALVLARAV
jgi:dimethylhistidine N-methyltransferase